MTDRHEAMEFLRHKKRLLKLLNRHSVDGVEFEMQANKLNLNDGTQSHSFDEALLRQLQSSNAVLVCKNRLRILPRGLAELKKLLQPEYEASLRKTVPERKLMTAAVKHSGADQNVMKNVNESPLSRLFHRRHRDGTTYITLSQFEAGERIRKDFEKGGLQPRISAMLETSVGSTGGKAGHGACDFADFTLDARNRVRQAIERLGPELSGVVLDVCCFLKGLELVERERSWPPRSAKLMLRTGLSILARHYGLEATSDNRNSKSRHWGTDDYRPVLPA
jgi:hypothetical protein